ncbi:uncharacterized protein LOC123293839 isoform X2 [Chrysoperla carnea]|uniref:uncharacterized protein LOC123293839 isoform X2 n=1 Tax=Chrysoperla carnea TaxID=189513 RepID=UPI001D076CE9|nr:uncharacterized protein LOC123293839 isoform X2 [Chrysoperla carnea]
MLVVVLCCMMKIVEMTSGRRAKNRQQLYNKRRIGLNDGRGGKEMTEVVCGDTYSPHSPDSDCNSNPTGELANTQDHFVSSCVSTTSQDAEFVQDNSDYQWFIDYGYRDSSSNLQHVSVLSSLCTSYTGDDLGFYDAMSKNLDANLAEADMESFRTEDIHSLLTTLPTMCTDMQIVQENNREGEMYASMSGSLMEKFEMESSLSQHTSSQGEDSTGLIDTMSICKSELLFSPVREVPMPGHNYSVDSLDCELPNEQDIMLTCQANKNNYTIAFEDKTSESNSIDNTEDINNKKLPLDNNSMIKSDLGLTTWSKLNKKRSCELKLRRHPSGNNNNHTTNDSTQYGGSIMHSTNPLKSQSMPNLYKQKNRLLSSHFNIEMNNKNKNAMNSSSIESYSGMQRFPSGCIKVFDIQHQTNSGSLFSDIASSMDGFDSSCSDNNRQSTGKIVTPNLNLVKRFIKQKSISAEGMTLDMDKSSASEYNCHSGTTSAGSLDNRLKDKMSTSVNDNDNCDNRHYNRLENQFNNWLRIESDTEKTDNQKDTKRIRNFPKLFNVNNNNSFDHSDTSSNRGDSERLEIKKDAEIASSAESASISMCSSSEATETTKFQRYSPRSNRFRLPRIIQTPLDVIDRSIQTSLLSNIDDKEKCDDYVKVIEPSFLNKLKSDNKEKPVYVLYPEYTLPSLDFLKDNTNDLTKIFLMPQKFVPCQSDTVAPSKEKTNKTRPFSCNDVETLKKRGFGHVKDWDSLTFLLPTEYRQILAEVPEVIEQINVKPDELLRQKERPLFCVTPPMRHKVRPQSCDLTGFIDRTNVSSSSSTATQPSSGYRGSSTMLLTDSVQNATQAPVTSSGGNNFNPLFIYRYDSVTSSEASVLMNEKKLPGAPPLPKRSTSLPNGENKMLPKGILRKSVENYKKNRKLEKKLYEYNTDDSYADEGVDAGNDSSIENNDCAIARPPTPPLPKTIETSSVSSASQDELQQLEDFLKQSGFSCSDNDEWDDNDVLKLRSCVNKFLSLKINQNRYGRKNVTFSHHLNFDENNDVLSKCTPVPAVRHCPNKGLVELPIHEEGETSSEERSPKNSPVRNITTSRATNDFVENKAVLITAVKDAVDQIIDHFALAKDHEELNNLGNTMETPACGKLLLATLCPALYAILSDGLKPSIDTTFGAISNSVWQVIEGSSHDGPLTKSLNELVMRINTEDVITEGLIKFNAFIFGLLNVQSLDVWLSYLRMRESILRKHYHSDSLLLMAHTGGSDIRRLIDLLITSLQPLNMLPFQIDLMFEYRQLQISMKRMGSFQASSPIHLKISPTKSQISSKQWALFKIVQSIQNSLTQSNSNEEICTEHIEQLLSPEIAQTLREKAVKPRPRSFIDHNVVSDVTNSEKKRWSDVHPGSKLHQAFDRLVAEDSDEEYTDSLEPEINNKTNKNATGSPKKVAEPPQGAKFRRLQMKWEMLSNEITNRPSSQTDSSSRTSNISSSGRSKSPESPTQKESKTPESPAHTPSSKKSKIPRLIPSPVRANSTLTNASLQKTNIPVKKMSGIPLPGSGVIKRQNTESNIVRTRPKKAEQQTTPTRSSRMDQHETAGNSLRHPTRPTSLPYNQQLTKSSKLTPPRRAVSSSLHRVNKTPIKATPKVVRTLTHRLQADNGHLSFNEGEKLTVMLEVDDKWLLCCRGTQKGLVPRSAVLILESDMSKRF